MKKSIFLLVTLVLLLFGCSQAPLTKEEYTKQVNIVLSEMSKSTESFDKTIDTVDAKYMGYSITSEDRKEINSIFEKEHIKAEKIAEEVKKIIPPAEYEEFHNHLINLTEMFADLNNFKAADGLDYDIAHATKDAWEYGSLAGKWIKEYDKVMIDYADQLNGTVDW